MPGLTSLQQNSLEKRKTCIEVLAVGPCTYTGHSLGLTSTTISFEVLQYILL